MSEEDNFSFSLLAESLRPFFDLAGTVLPVVMYLAPIQAMLLIVSSKDVGPLPSLPFSSMFLCCMLWVMFGLRLSEIPVIVPNAIGCGLSIAYILLYSKYTKSTFILKQEASLALAVGSLGFFMYHTCEKFYIGTLAAISSVSMFSAPLAQLKTVVSTKSCAALGPLPNVVVCWMSTFVWFILGYFYLGNAQVWVANLLGCLSCTLSLSLFARYASKTNGEGYESMKEEKPRADTATMGEMFPPVGHINVGRAVERV